MTNEQINKIEAMRIAGAGYKAIASKLNLPAGTVKSWFRRHPLNNESVCKENRCVQCGASYTQKPHTRPRRFCSDGCRNKWWSEHREQRTVKTAYRHICIGCGREFENGRREAAYCSRACFADARRRP